MWGCGVRFIDGFLEWSEGEGTMNSRDRHASCVSEFRREKSLMVVTRSWQERPFHLYGSIASEVLVWYKFQELAGKALPTSLWAF
ncbi:hypothetical protein Tco_1167997 [Tanacetum coccineum]